MAVAEMTRSSFSGDVEKLIGILTMALGLAIFRPNQSIPYQVLNIGGYGTAWAVAFIGFGSIMALAACGHNPRTRLFGATLTFILWSILTGLTLIGGDVGPTAYNGFVLCAYLLDVIRRHLRDGRVPQSSRGRCQ